MAPPPDEHRRFPQTLRFPAAISEKLGLSLAKALEADQELAATLRAALAGAGPETAEAELVVLNAALAPQTAPKPKATRRAPTTPKVDLTRYDITSGLVLRHWPETGRVELSGDQVDDNLLRDRKDWLERR